MKILFLHGWQSTPGGLKPTYLKDCGHEVLNPALPDDDIDAAVSIAQTEFDQHHPDVVVGSSRGGTVAMNINPGSIPLVLLCPAWKRFGTARTIKPGTVILHSKADDVVPFTDSLELVRNSGLPESLIVVGTEHRLADPESLKAMLGGVREGCKIKELVRISQFELQRHQAGTMLQIITGRFFGDGKVNEREFDGVLYSNYSWTCPITTGVAELRPSDSRGTRISSYVVRYKVRYEQRPGDILVLPTGDQAADQFRLLCAFWFQAFLHSDRYHVEMLCRTEPRHSADSGVPSRFVNRFFDAPIRGDWQEVAGFSGFIDKVLAMPRKSYRLFMSCLGVFFDALEAIDSNQNLAYSMFVYLLEALTQAGDGFVPVWADYPENLREQLDKEFSELDSTKVEAIRHVLLSNPNVKLKKRFIQYISDHIEGSFFTSEATGRTPALRKNELGRALGNLYDTRSGYVHSLRPIQQHLRLPGWIPHADVFQWENEPYLTFSGLARLGRHVLLRVVERQPCLDREEHPGWRTELPGMVVAEVAPQYWIWQVEGFSPSHAKRRFSAFVSHVVGCFESKKYGLPDMRGLMERIEAMVSQATVADRRAMLCLYWIYNVIVSGNDQRQHREEFLGRYEQDIETCSIECVASVVILRVPLAWPVEDCERVFQEYLKRKFKANAVNLPKTVEVAVMVAIANVHLENGDLGAFEQWMERAILDASGRNAIQELLRKAQEERKPLRPTEVLGVCGEPSPREGY